jgi:hypothetical protein
VVWFGLPGKVVCPAVVGDDVEGQLGHGKARSVPFGRL